MLYIQAYTETKLGYATEKRYTRVAYTVGMSNPRSLLMRLSKKFFEIFGPAVISNFEVKTFFDFID